MEGAKRRDGVVVPARRGLYVIACVMARRDWILYMVVVSPSSAVPPPTLLSLIFSCAVYPFFVTSACYCLSIVLFHSTSSIMAQHETLNDLAAKVTDLAAQFTTFLADSKIPAPNFSASSPTSYTGLTSESFLLRQKLLDALNDMWILTQGPSESIFNYCHNVSLLVRGNERRQMLTPSPGLPRPGVAEHPQPLRLLGRRAPGRLRVVRRHRHEHAAAPGRRPARPRARRDAAAVRAGRGEAGPRPALVALGGAEAVCRSPGSRVHCP